jgi:site-specific recombinase XerD
MTRPVLLSPQRPMGRSPGGPLRRREPTGDAVPVKRLPPVVRAAYVEWMVNERGWSRETRRTRLATIEHANGVWDREGRNYRTANREDVLAFIGSTGHPRTRNRKLGDLRGFYRFATVTRVANHDPTIGIIRVREPRLLPRPLTREEAKALLVGAALVSQRAYTAVGLLLYCGLRREEATSLTWGEVDLHGGTLRVNGKGSKERVVPIPPALRAILTAWHFRDPHAAWMFSSTQRAGEHMSAITLWHDVTDAAMVGQVPNVTPHRLRHTYATEVLRLTHNVAAVQVLLGHASLASTQIYAKVEVSSLAADVAPLDFSA